eukprot:GILI01003366.1.p1 GENE.GILI01003366.1~~GILI01003366.1.p1  ORF type:complete len:138 (+),score=33.05 GILI01003366.1:226-639(+)
MSGHQHLGGVGLTQNQGNVVGDRPCVRQSRIYRENLGGNAMKELMGQDSLKWDTNRTQGAYDGGRVYDVDNDGVVRAGVNRADANPQPQANQAPPQQSYTSQSQQYGQHQQPEAQPQGHRRGAGVANKSTYNIITGQ